MKPWKCLQVRTDAKLLGGISHLQTNLWVSATGTGQVEERDVPSEYVGKLKNSNTIPRNRNQWTGAVQWSWRIVQESNFLPLMVKCGHQWILRGQMESTFSAQEYINLRECVYENEDSLLLHQKQLIVSLPPDRSAFVPCGQRYTNA